MTAFRGSVLILAALMCLPPAQAEKTRPIRVAVVTGGHTFEGKPFLSLFEGYSDIEYVHLPQEDDSEIFENIAAWPYDVLVLYNITQKIPEHRKENLLALLGRGVGVVALHHSIVSFQEWPQYKEIIGGKYYLEEMEESDVKRPKSAFLHDVDFKIHVLDRKHPITQGIKDFTVHDETYLRYTVDPGAHVLLGTDEPSSERVVGWVKNYGKARVCYLQMGHGPQIFADPSYRLLVSRAIRWSAGKLGSR